MTHNEQVNVVRNALTVDLMRGGKAIGPFLLEALDKAYASEDSAEAIIELVHRISDVIMGYKMQEIVLAAVYVMMSSIAVDMVGKFDEKAIELVQAVCEFSDDEMAKIVDQVMD